MHSRPQRVNAPRVGKRREIEGEREETMQRGEGVEKRETIEIEGLHRSTTLLLLLPLLLLLLLGEATSHLIHTHTQANTLHHHHLLHHHLLNLPQANTHETSRTQNHTHANNTCRFARRGAQKKRTETRATPRTWTSAGSNTRR
jgi:hypothetical protein